MARNDEIPCPACGFLTFTGAYGSYVICPVCNWEDDQAQLANPACGGGANSKSLIEAQIDALARYPFDVALAKGVRRDSRWRPLNDSEKRLAEKEREERHWKNEGIVEISECYWNKNLPTLRVTRRNNSLVQSVKLSK
jgi:hypothetical protein